MPTCGERAGARLSEEIAALLAGVGERGLTIREIEGALKGRGLDLFILLLSVPFLIPTPPGLAAPIGVALAVMGFRACLGQKPWLPKKVLDRSIPHGVLTRSLKLSIALVRRIESVSRPRWLLERQAGLVQRYVGFLVGLNGSLLALPLPIPLSNTLPAGAVICLTAGAMERDGLLVLLGTLLTVLAWGFVAAVLLLGEAGLRALFG